MKLLPLISNLDKLSLSEVTKAAEKHLEYFVYPRICQINSNLPASLANSLDERFLGYMQGDEYDFYSGVVARVNALNALHHFMQSDSSSNSNDESENDDQNSKVLANIWRKLLDRMFSPSEDDLEPEESPPPPRQSVPNRDDSRDERLPPRAATHRPSTSTAQQGLLQANHGPSPAGDDHARGAPRAYYQESSPRTSNSQEADYGYDQEQFYEDQQEYSSGYCYDDGYNGYNHQDFDSGWDQQATSSHSNTSRNDQAGSSRDHQASSDQPQNRSIQRIRQTVSQFEEHARLQKLLDFHERRYHLSNEAEVRKRFRSGADANFRLIFESMATGSDNFLGLDTEHLAFFIE